MGRLTSSRDAERILGQLRALSPIPLTNADLAEVLNMPHSHTRTHLMKLLGAGKIHEKPGTSHGHVTLYYVPEDA